MRANITYSVDVHSIPEEVTRIIVSEAENLSSYLYEVEAALEDKNFTEARNKLMSARQTLISTDIRLREMDQILAGFINILNRESEEEIEEEALDETEANAGG